MQHRELFWPQASMSWTFRWLLYNITVLPYQSFIFVFMQAKSFLRLLAKIM